MQIILIVANCNLENQFHMICLIYYILSEILNRKDIETLLFIIKIKYMNILLEIWVEVVMNSGHRMFAYVMAFVLNNIRKINNDLHYPISN